MFNTIVHAFAQAPKDRLVYRVHPATPFTLPPSLRGQLLFVTSVTDFPSKRMRLGSGIVADSDGAGEWSECLAKGTFIGAACPRVRFRLAAHACAFIIAPCRRSLHHPISSPFGG